MSFNRSGYLAPNIWKDMTELGGFERTEEKVAWCAIKYLPAFTRKD